uniref:Uncharacterized protein n=1 Tax=Rangifer tarandus platyrhynchus TaxID=3082113 RepID=A0ACB0FE17_RANTA|nr:unnamed protein product [Rangifer tarandus platyrhynchus]
MVRKVLSRCASDDFRLLLSRGLAVGGVAGKLVCGGGVGIGGSGRLWRYGEKGLTGFPNPQPPRGDPRPYISPPHPALACCRSTLQLSHTILLVQPTKRPEGRTYADYESVNECMEGVCKMYEEHLKRMNPNSPSITYDISQLFDFIDDLADLSCLVYRADTQTYQPYNKDWIKEKIYVLLRRQAQQAGK